MKFLIVGSLRHLENEKKAWFKQACAELGEAFVDRQQILHLCSAHEDTADPYVVSGASSKAGCEMVFFRANPETYVAHPTADVLRYENNTFNSGVKVSWVSCKGDWNTVFSHALRESDAVFAIGGGVSGTRPVIELAVAGGKPLVLIPSFGGEASAAWSNLESHYLVEERNVLKEDWHSGKWGENIVQAAISIAKRANHF
ncbi:MAG: hypothetical protein NT159_19410 [Proteobacteria bacterium]|nr:hypothetical protein [Pseudomonadota bacterium]